MSEIIIYCDESDSKGKFYSNFYGGALITSTHKEYLTEKLNSKKADLNFNNEIKWSRVTGNYLEKYKELMNDFFDLIKGNKIKVRIMFTQNIHEVNNLTSYQKDNKYFLLYYQFLKHAFGLQYANPTNQTIKIRLNLDELPETKEKVSQFKSYIRSLTDHPPFREANIVFPVDQIASVDSKDHVILQCLDVVLGAMQFRLNDKHKVLSDGQRRRGSRTIAKESLYKHINQNIRVLYPNFNVGCSTSTRGNTENRWHDPYRHWLFVPKNHSVNKMKGKQSQ